MISSTFVDSLSSQAPRLIARSITSAVTPSFFAAWIASARALFWLTSAHFSAAIDISFAWSVFTFAFALAFLSFWACTVGQRHIWKN